MLQILLYDVLFFPFRGAFKIIENSYYLKKCFVTHTTMSSHYIDSVYFINNDENNSLVAVNQYCAQKTGSYVRRALILIGFRSLACLLAFTPNMIKIIKKNKQMKDVV